jgi:pimeloyl-ACP methyl ester carboxylesterase
MLAWSERGEGPPLLLINGYAATKDDWDPTFLDELASDFRLICPDNRGVGESELGDPEGMTAASLAGDCVELLDSLGVGRAAVVGWSMGGMVAQELAAWAPERVSALVLLSTDCGGEKAVLAEPEATARLYDRSGTPREQATRLLRLLFPPEVAAPIDAEFGEVVAAARAALNPAALDAQQELLAHWHSEPADGRLKAIAAKTLVAAGDEDQVIPPENTPILAAALGGAQMHCFPGGGHAFMAQEPQRLAALIRIFIEAT